MSILNFPSKAAAERAIRQELEQHPLDTPFQSDLIQNLIQRHHPILAGRGEYPEWFYKNSNNPRGKGYYFQGYFPARDLWWGVSWTECIKPPPTLKDRIAECFREYISIATIWYRVQNPICEICGDLAEDTDHANPGGFNFIFKQVYRFNPPSLWAWYFENYYDFWSPEKEKWIPESDPAIRYLKEIHEDGTIALQSLCKPCHRKVGRERKSART